jgi:hypothetical protein
VWALGTDELERAGPKTRAVMICNPNNPTGHVLLPAEMDAVVAAAERVGAWIVADEIYRGAEVDTDETTPSFWGRSERTVITSGLSKAFGLPGLRVGWAVAPAELVRELWVRHDYTLTPGLLSDWFAAIAMEPDRREQILRRTRGIIRSNLPLLEGWIEAQPALSAIRPGAGAIAYVQHDLPIASTELVDRIRREQSVLLVPGEMFGIDRGFRIGRFDADQMMGPRARGSARRERLRRRWRTVTTSPQGPRSAAAATDHRSARAREHGLTARQSRRRRRAPDRQGSIFQHPSKGRPALRCLPRRREALPRGSTCREVLNATSGRLATGSTARST